MSKQEIQKAMSDHWTRIKSLQNSNDPYKWEDIALLSKEYQELKAMINKEV